VSLPAFPNYTFSPIYTADDSALTTKPKKARGHQNMVNRILALREKSKSSKQWFDKYRLDQTCNCFNPRTGTCSIPTDWLEHPEKHVEARNRKEDQVAKIEKSVETHGVQRTDIVVLVWQENLEKHFGKYEIDMALSFDTTGAAPADIKFQTICGDHTVAAIQDLHRQYPRNKDFKFVDCVLVICPKTFENIDLAYHFGCVDNEIKGLTENLSVFDVVKAIHDRMVEVEEMKISNEEQSRLLETSIENIRSMCEVKYAKNTFGSARAMAKRRGELWENLLKIFETADKGQKPKGIGHFVNMGNVPEERLVAWSSQVVAESITTSEFNKKCLLFKKERRVRATLLDLILTKMPSLGTEHNIRSWTDLVNRFEFLGNKEYMGSILAWFPDQEKKVPDKTLLNGVLQRVESEENSRTGDAANIKVLCFLSCLNSSHPQFI
jgi:hypothetical protein